MASERCEPADPTRSGWHWVRRNPRPFENRARAFWSADRWRWEGRNCHADPRGMYLLGWRYVTTALEAASIKGIGDE